jgi:hypothetical protein
VRRVPALLSKHQVKIRYWKYIHPQGRSTGIPLLSRFFQLRPSVDQVETPGVGARSLNCLVFVGKLIASWA